MGTNIADLPDHIQRQINQQIAADAARRAAQCRTCQGARTIKVNGKTVRCYECRGKVEGGKVIPAKRTKYGNVRTSYKSTQGFERVYDSMGEANYAATLDQGIAAGLIKYWLPQIPIPLPGGVKLVVDFLVQWNDRLAFVDFKGVLTREAANKIKQAKAIFNIDVELVHKP